MPDGLHRALILVALIAAACAPGAEIPMPTTTAPASEPVRQATEAPTDTPSPDSIVLVDQGANEAWISRQPMLASLQELADQAGWALLVRDALNLSGTASSTRMVILFEEPEDLTALAADHPDITFVLIAPELAPSAENVWAVGAGGLPYEAFAFAAGYTTAVITDDWRAGMVAAAEGAVTQRLKNGFGAGLRYFCGLCRPAHPPYVSYPVFHEIASEPGEQANSEAASALTEAGVSSVYVTPTIGSEELFGALSARGMRLLGAAKPSGDVLDHWVATIRPAPESSLREHWADLSAGNVPEPVTMPVMLDDRNQAQLSEARLRLIVEMLAELNAGYIDPSP